MFRVVLVLAALFTLSACEGRYRVPADYDRANQGQQGNDSGPTGAPRTPTR